LVKWGSIIKLANDNSLADILVIAYFRRSATPKLTKNGVPFVILPAVWKHFRDIDDIQRLASAERLRIHMFKQPFSHRQRHQYVAGAVEAISKMDQKQKIVFLDPDTGIEPGTPNAKHVTSHDIEAYWGAISPMDWLVMYQHKRQSEKGWLATTQNQFRQACNGATVSVFQGPDIAHDVAFFAAQKEEPKHPLNQ
jgi:hypothetical protein